MNQPTREEFEQLKEEMRKLREQVTEPIKVTRIEIDTGDVRERFDRIELKQADHSERLDTMARGQQELKQELHAHSETWLKSLQEHSDQIRSDIQTAQGTHNERLDHIETAQTRIESTQTEQGKRLDTVDGKLDQILALLQQKRQGE